jgi:hypothetical protein
MIKNISTLRKLCFDNGYYDFQKQEFINNYDNIETNIKIDRDFPERNENVIFSIYGKSFETYFRS